MSQCVCVISYKWENPGIYTELRRVSHHKDRALFYACGPKSLTDHCRKLAAESGVAFRSEGFEL